MAFTFPVSLNLTGRCCLVLGGGPVAVAKAEALVDSAAQVVVFTPQPHERLRQLATRGIVRLHHRPHEAGDLRGAFLAIATGEDQVSNTRLWEEAEAHGVLLLAVDDPAHCHLAAMSVVRRGDLRIAISTGGKAPALAKRLRQQLECQFGREWGELVDVVHGTRQRLLPHRPPFEEWSCRWADALSDLDWLVDGLARGQHDEVRAYLSRRCSTTLTTIRQL